MIPSGHKAFLVNNVNDVELLLMHNKTYAAEYVTCPSRALKRTWDRRHGGGRGIPCGNGTLTRYLQDRPQRLLEEACRHHCAGEAIRCEGHQREGEGHDGGLNDGRQPWGESFLCFGASQAVSGEGLLFVCDCLASTRASEYNCSLLRHGQNGQQLASVTGFSLRALGGRCFWDSAGMIRIDEPHAGRLQGSGDDLACLGWAIKRIPPFLPGPGGRYEHQHSDEGIQSIRRFWISSAPLCSPLVPSRRLDQQQALQPVRHCARSVCPLWHRTGDHTNEALMKAHCILSGLQELRPGDVQDTRHGYCPTSKTHSGFNGGELPKMSQIRQLLIKGAALSEDVDECGRKRCWTGSWRSRKCTADGISQR